MRRKSVFLTIILLAVSSTAFAEPLNDRHQAFVDAAGACVDATGYRGVDRGILASAGWGRIGSGEIDHNPVSAAWSEQNPFPLRINAFELGDPEECWVTAEFDPSRDFGEVRRLLERRLRREPDSAEPDDMRTTRWLNPQNVVELWMMPANEALGIDPNIFVSVVPRPTN
jgi:hypothetical protein